MKTQEFIVQMERYFQSERRSSLLLILIGGAFLSFGIWIWSSGSTNDLLQGFAISSSLIGTIQVLTGSVIFARSSAKRAYYPKKVVESRSTFLHREIDRMKRVNKNYSLFRIGEISLIVIGIVLLFFKLHENYLLGIGLGMALQSSFLLAIDYFAELSGEKYLRELLELKNYTSKGESYSAEKASLESFIQPR